MEQPGYITIQSKSDRKEFFNIYLYNDINNDIINHSLITQSINYKLNDNNWETFTVPYNNYMTRFVLYGYQVTLGDYISEVDSNNFAYNIVENNCGKFSVSSSYEYNAYGDVFMNNLIGIEINEIDDMTAQELLGEIQSLRNELNELKNNLTYSYISINDIKIYATQSYVNSYVGSYVINKHYLTQQDLIGYATESYVIDKINNIPSVDLSSYATKSYVIDKINNISSVDISSYTMRADITDLSNRISTLETITMQERIEFLIPIGDSETLLPQPIFDEETWSVNHYTDRKTISFSIKSNCKFNVNVEYKNSTNDYNQVTLLSVKYADNDEIPSKLLSNTQFDATGNTVKTISLTFDLKNYDKDDNVKSIDTQTIISVASINDSSIKQTQLHIFKCWNNIAFVEEKPADQEVPEEIIEPMSYMINNNYNSITSYSYWNISYNSLPNIVKEFISDKNIYANIININPSLYLSYSYLDNIDCVILTGSTCMFTPNWITEGENKEIRTIDNTYYYPNDITNSSTFILYSYEIFDNTIKYRSSLLIENSYITGIINFENGNYESQYLQLFNSDKWNNIISQNNQLTLYLNSSYIEQSILDIPYLGELI